MERGICMKGKKKKIFLTLSLTLDSWSSYVWDLSLTAGRVWGAGLDSKLVLKRVSIRVLLPIPVSPAE